MFCHPCRVCVRVSVLSLLDGENLRKIWSLSHHKWNFSKGLWSECALCENARWCSIGEKLICRRLSQESNSALFFSRFPGALYYIAAQMDRAAEREIMLVHNSCRCCCGSRLETPQSNLRLATQQSKRLEEESAVYLLEDALLFGARRRESFKFKSGARATN